MNKKNISKKILADLATAREKLQQVKHAIQILKAKIQRGLIKTDDILEKLDEIDESL